MKTLEIKKSILSVLTANAGKSLALLKRVGKKLKEEADHGAEIHNRMTRMQEERYRSNHYHIRGMRGFF